MKPVFRMGRLLGALLIAGNAYAQIEVPVPDASHTAFRGSCAVLVEHAYQTLGDFNLEIRDNPQACVGQIFSLAAIEGGESESIYVEYQGDIASPKFFTSHNDVDDLEMYISNAVPGNTISFITTLKSGREVSCGGAIVKLD